MDETIYYPNKIWYGNCLHDINKRHSENLRVTLLF